MKRSMIFLIAIATSFVMFSQKKQQTLVTINDTEISVNEFKKVYEKNLDAIEDEAFKDVKINLDLFINYKLKVKEAYHIKLDTLASYKREIETYRNQLSAPYLQDKKFTEKLIEETYFRTKNEIRAKHILIRIQKGATPKDTLVAFDKITTIRNRILSGEDFEKVAEETSEDASARDNAARNRKGNKGNLGYFSAFKMLYSFEDAAYKTNVGDLSKPFRTTYGYHIIKVDELRASKGEIEVAHILINDTTNVGATKIGEVYRKLEEQKEFKILAKEYSNDAASKNKGGKLKKFGIGSMVPSFEKVAFSLKAIGDYSQPFRSRYGWHIVTLLKTHPVLPFKDMKPALTSKLKRSGRMKLSDAAVLNKLKRAYTILENKASKAILMRKNIRAIPKDSLQNTLFSINDKAIQQEVFVNYLRNRRHKSVLALFNEFKNQEILKYFKENLVNTEPEYANTMQEYEDGLLLFELMQQKIWNRSSKDTLGLQNYFIDHKKNYTGKELINIKGQVINDYQNFLEQNWIADLRKKNTIKVNKRALKKLIKFYDKK